MIDRKLKQTGVLLRRGLRAIRPYAEVVGNVAEAALSAQRSGVGVALGLASVAAKSAAQNSSGNWEMIYSGRQGAIARLAFDGTESYDVHGWRGYLADGFEFVVYEDQVYCTPGFAGRAKDEVKRRLRQKFAGGARLLVTRNTSAEVSLREETRSGFAGCIARAVRKRVAPVLRARGRRSVLLYGSPGTGKTTAATWIARELSDVVLFVGGSGANGLGDLPLVCDMLAPGAVILDDVETFDDLPVLLDFLEAPDRPPLVLLTSNCTPGDESRLSRALLRCDRVDETFEVEGNRDDVRIGVFQKMSDDVWERVRAWSPASLQEVATRAEIFGLDALNLDEIERREGMKTDGS